MPYYHLSEKAFLNENWEETLILLLLAHKNNEEIISKKVIPPEFLSWAADKYCELRLSLSIINGNHSNWIITPFPTEDVQISIGNIVRFKQAGSASNENMRVVEETKLLAGVKYIQNELENGTQVTKEVFRWLLKADLELAR